MDKELKKKLMYNLTEALKYLPSDPSNNISKTELINAIKLASELD